MRNDALAFAVANESASKSPRFVVRISFDSIDFDLLYLTSHSDTSTPINASVIENVVRGIGGSTQRIDPLAGNSEIGNISFSAIDKAGELTAAINSRLDNDNGLRKKKVVYYQGYEGMAWEDYQAVHTFIIDRIRYRDGVYTFSTSDIQREVREQVFQPKQLYLNGAVGAADTLIPVTGTDLSVFQLVAHDDRYSAHPSISVGYVKIDKEVVAHTGMLNHAELGTVLQVKQRGALGTQAVAHDVDLTQPEERRPEVDEHIYFEGAAPKLAYAILTGDLDGQPGESLPPHWHLGINQSLVRLSDFQNIGDDYWNTSLDTGKHMRFEGVKKQAGKKFVEKELLLWIGAFMPVYSDGSIGIKRLASVLAGAGHVAVLNEQNVVSYSDLDHDYSSLLNNMRIEWNWLDIKGEFTKTSVFIDSDSISKHGDADIKTLKFKGVHTGVNAEEDIIAHIDTLRDRHSGPPLRITIEVLPSMNRLEVGDRVRLQLSQVRDFVTGNDLDRVFEIQRVQTDWQSGRLSLELFASSQAAGELSRTTLSSVLNDAFYTSEGIDLTTVLNITGGAVVSNGTLNGHPTDNGQAVYYYNGDLTISDGVVVTITENVQLRIRGDLVINGIIDGKGRGAVGGSGMTSYIASGEPSNATDGAKGGFGSTRSFAGYQFSVMPFGLSKPPISRVFNTGPHDTVLPIHYDSLPYFTLVNNGDTLAGLPKNLRGTGGSGGGGRVLHAVNPFGPDVWSMAGDGGAGGAGGAGFVMIARGYAYGPNGKIDTSGDDGAAGDALGATGAGGSAGAVLALIDGNSSPFNLRQKHIANRGDGSITITASYHNSTIQNYYAVGSGFTAADMSDAAGRVQYLPIQQSIVEQSIKPFEVSSFTALENGATVVLRWVYESDVEVAGFDIRYGPRGNVTYADATPLTRATKGTSITTTDVPPGDWTFMIKPVSIDNLYALNAATSDLLVSNSHDVIYQIQQAPSWPGVLSHFIKHHTGVLIPDSQNLANEDEWDTFDLFVVNPFPLCSYEASEIDIGFDDDVRVWAEIDSALGPGEFNGVADPELLVDHRAQMEAYDGFELFSVGGLSGRYFKQKIQVDTSKGVPKITGFLPTVDLLEHKINAQDVSILSSGDTVIFSQPFHAPPFVRVFVKGTSSQHVVVNNITSTGFDVRLFDDSGTGVAGTIDWEAVGV